MSGSKKSFGKGLLENATWDGIKSLAFGALAAVSSGAAGGLLSVSLSRHIERLQPYTPWLTILLVSGLPLAGILTIRRFSRTWPRRAAIHADFRILRKEIRLVFVDRHHATYTRTYDIKALRGGLDRYLDKFHWTGSSLPEFRSVNSNHTLHLSGRRNIWRLFEVHFGRYIEKGESIRISVSCDLDDTAELMVPFVSAVIEEPTDELLFSLEFPRNSGVGKVVCEISHSIGARMPLKTKEYDVGADGRFEWPLTPTKRTAPRLLHAYEVRWHWPTTANQH